VATTRCDNCERVIGKLEVTHIHGDHMVCEECRGALDGRAELTVQQRLEAVGGQSPSSRQSDVKINNDEKCRCPHVLCIIAYVILALQAIAFVIAFGAGLFSALQPVAPIDQSNIDEASKQIQFKIAYDAVKQFEIVAKSEHSTKMELYIAAQVCANACLQLKDQESYDHWMKIASQYK
jgi:hypothetical protein